MSLQPPKIDKRSYEDIVKQTEDLVKNFTDWRPRSDGKPDAGMALIRIFGRMAALVSDRLNQVPEKNFLAFLDLIGTQISPPQPARVPLTFKLVEGSSVEALVPAGTQIAAPPIKGEEEEVVFETEGDLVVVPTRLKAVFVREPSQDRYSDRTPEATGQKDAAFLAFAAEKSIEHYLYLANDDLLAMPRNKIVTLAFDSPQAEELKKLFVTWSYWGGTSWQDFTPSQSVESKKLKVKIENFPILKKLALNGLEAEWLRVKLDGSKLSDQKSLPPIESVSVNVKVTSPTILPDLCFFNSTPIDLSKDFYPFGEQPRFNDTFYSASREALAKAGAEVTLEIELSNLGLKDNVEIIWEVGNGSTWEQLRRSSDSESKKEKNHNFNDKTQAFAQNGQVTFTLTDKLNFTTVNGENSYWFRARIARGDYGKPATFTKKTDSNNHPIYEFIEATFNAPSIKSLKLSYTYKSDERPLSLCRAYNDFTYSDFFTTVLSAEVKIGDKILNLASVTSLAKGDRLRITGDSSNSEENEIEALDLLNKTVRLKQAIKNNYNFNTKVVRVFLPFTPTRDQNPTLYLGFDQPFPNRAINLYLQVEPPKPGEIAKALKDKNQQIGPPRIVWEYYNSKDWVSLGVKDETNAFTQSGVIEFIGPQDITLRYEFGQSLYWIRARWESGEFFLPPRLGRILTNTIWASQVTRIKEELLGSSDGKPNQTYRTAQFPVLPGQRLEVRRPQIPSSDELAALEKSLGKNALTIVHDNWGQVEEVWIMWEEVRNFYASSAGDRHYIIDHLTGEVQFGDGVRGMVSPQGRNNIRLAQYRTGGGKKGNLPEQRITQIKTTIPYMESVTNYEAAGGGAEQESLERVKERGPKWLRHRDRAVTSQDFEDLAYEASSEVARAKVITPELASKYNPLDPSLWLIPHSESQPKTAHNAVKTDKIELIIVPYSLERQPTPSLALLNLVKNYISQRCNPTVNLIVTAPQWKEVTITAEIVPSDIEKAELVRTNVIQNLEVFLHPLTGGKGKGWQFGRYPHDSNIYALIQSVPGVNYVASLKTNLPDKLEANSLIYSGSHTITSISPRERG